MKRKGFWVLIQRNNERIMKPARIMLLCLLLGIAQGCSTAASTGKMTFNLFEYNRGFSFPNRSDVVITTGAGETRFHDVRLEGSSFYPDGSIIPNAFIKPLLNLHFGDALKAFTEPYYGIRFFHFFKSHPHWGIGIDFIHLKVFMADLEQKVSVTGPWPDVPPDGQILLKDHFATLNVSHGVNHVTFSGIYRWMLLPSAKIPDGRLQPFISLGAGPAVPHLQLTLNRDGQSQRKAYSYNWRFGNWGMGAGAGLRWKISPKFGLYGEYKWTYSILDEMHFDNGEEGRVRMRFPTHHLVWGMSLVF
jgi:hypothetical protein